MRTRRSETELSPGDRRLLHDLAVVERVLRPAEERVEQVLGVELARAVRAELEERPAEAA